MRMRALHYITVILAVAGAIAGMGTAAGTARAEPVMRAVPAVAVEETLVPDQMGHGVVFLELYTSEECPFCPEAERNFKDLVDQNGVIGFSCVVDYFSPSDHGQLARPFCAARQDFYMKRLDTGPRYTPQLVINGVTHMTGRDMQQLAAAITAAQQRPAKVLHIEPGTRVGDYDVVLPRMDTEVGDGPYMLRMAMIAHERDTKRGVLVNYMDQLINGGQWNGAATIWTVTPPRNVAGVNSFIVFVQSSVTGRIVAAAIEDLE